MRTASGVMSLAIVMGSLMGCDPVVECEGEACGDNEPDKEPDESEPMPEDIEEPPAAPRTNKVDILFIVDNSGTMTDEQARIGRAMATLERDLLDRDLDVQVMFTTTDFGMSACDEHRPEGYEPARGRPTTSACSERLGDFVGLEGEFGEVPESCESVCPIPAAPQGAPFVAFNSDGTNAPGVTQRDIDGDGVPDSATAMTLACLAPQGINGCGYESPLENIVQAMNAEAQWNQGPNPFIREDAVLAIGLITDEADCSISDFTLMEDEAYMEIDPATGTREPSSALCWNAGVTCVGADGQGGYDDCVASESGPLHPLYRYQRHLIERVRENRDKEVVMLGVVGVPSVLEHADESPFQPLAGGVADLEYRDWADGPFPRGDLLPSDIEAGRTAEHKQFTYGVGPGCTSLGPDGIVSQGQPPARIVEVCESLDVGDGPKDARCCLESICDNDYGPAMKCLVGLIDNVTAP